MPWRGPEYKGEFPTLGYQVGDWIEANVIIPDGDRKGERYLLTDEMWHHLLWSYRLDPDATPQMRSRAFRYYGGLLVRPQKWGKDPFAAAQICAQALADTQFDGWDAAGEPVGRPVATPVIQCVANSEEQTPVTFAPVYTMLTEGPLASWPGLDPGLTRINLPGGGEVKAVSSSARSRIGARLTFASFTETHLFTESSGGIEVARAMKRNLAGMGGRWIEITNAWNPAEASVAQRTHESAAPGVFIDYRPPRTRVDLEDDAALHAELLYVYGDSAMERGGWVDVERIMAEARDKSTGEGQARRFFLNEVTVGSRDAIDVIRWAAQARPGESLKAGERITLGFHGSQTRDATSLVASRISDGRLFHLRTWEKPGHVAERQWSVPRDEVNQAVHDAFAGFDVVVLMATPATWQDEVNAWEGKYPKQILELWTNSEVRMDQLVERFMTAHRAVNAELTHDGNETLTAHATAAALADGKRRPAGEDRAPGQPDHYQRVVRKSWALSTSAFIAGLLAYEARGWAYEHGLAQGPDSGPPNLW